MIVGPPVHRGSTCSCTPFPKVLHRPSLARRLGCWAAVAAGVWRQQVRERCIQEDGWHQRVFGKRVLQSASSADSRVVIPALESFCDSLSVYVCDYLTAVSRRCPRRERERERVAILAQVLHLCSEACTASLHRGERQEVDLGAVHP